jgi:hypothetical protein
MGSEGIGQGIAEGVRVGGSFLLQGLQMKQRKDLIERQFDADLEWKRGMAGLGPSDEEADQHADATRPAIPSSTPTVTTGQMGVPQTTFNTGRPVQSRPAAPAPQASGAALLTPGMRAPRMKGLRYRF